MSGLLARLASTRDVIDTADAFQRSSIHVGRPLCTPISAKAAVYAMPGEGRRMAPDARRGGAVRGGQVGTVTITFEKRVRELQFDMIEGDTPQEISPLGHRGTARCCSPLDTATTLQSFGPPRRLR